MSLDFGDQLFVSGPLQQDTGLLSERWGQTGSNIVNSSQRLSVTASTDKTAYTVTTNKTLYVKSITQIDIGATQNTVIFKDGTGGTEVFRWGLAAGANQVTFDVPLKFTTSVVVNASANSATHDTAFEGWEE